MAAPVPENHLVAHSEIQQNHPVCFCRHHLKPCMVYSPLTFSRQTNHLNLLNNLPLLGIGTISFHVHIEIVHLPVPCKKIVCGQIPPSSIITDSKSQL